MHAKFSKYWLTLSKVDGGIHRQHGGRISLLLLFQNKESRLKYVRERRDAIVSGGRTTCFWVPLYPLSSTNADVLGGEDTDFRCVCVYKFHIRKTKYHGWQN
jgi:hypothetical protein